MTLGVLVSKSIQDAKGGSGGTYSRWRLSNLKGEEVVLMLFGGAHTCHFAMVRGQELETCVQGADGGTPAPAPAPAPPPCTPSLRPLLILRLCRPHNQQPGTFRARYTSPFSLNPPLLSPDTTHSCARWRAVWWGCTAPRCLTPMAASA